MESAKLARFLYETAYVVVVDPDVRRVLDFNEILALRGVVEVQVPEDNVRCLLDPEPTVRQA